MRKLIIGGMSLNTTKEHLRETFEKFGELIEVSIDLDPATGFCDGYGHVVFSKEEDAKNAVTAMKSRLCWQVWLSNDKKIS